MNENETPNAMLDEIADSIFTTMIESSEFDVLTSTQRTIVTAKIAALAATYAGDALDF